MASEEESYLIVDVDGHETKAILIEQTEGGFGIKGAAEASTTVDPPDLDVTIGVEGAVRGLGRRLGRDLWGPEGPSGAHRFLCSSNTSGGIYMTVAGLIRQISAESAERAALGAGALLMDVFSKDDPRPDFMVVERMRSLRPDMFLLAGGTDGGAEDQVIEMAGLIGAADVRPRFGSEYKLPVIYAGNVEIRGDVSEALTEERYATRVVENVRPVIEEENLGPAREGIYDSYMEHVIIHSPGYDKLVRWVEGNIIPTQAAIGKILYAYAQEREINMLAFDVGGATTDVYSVYNGVFNRSLNADIGMTYGISNIMKEAGVENLMRWMPEGLGEKEVRNIVGNIMALQPSTLTREEARVVQAAAREAMRLGLELHRSYVTRLKGVKIERTIADLFDQFLKASLLDLMRTHAIIGRGGIFTDEQMNGNAALLLLDAVQPEGVTEIMVDRSSVLPHLGLLVDLNSEAALQILREECLTRLGTCVAVKGIVAEGVEAMRLLLTKADGAVVEETADFGELKAIPLGANETAKLEVRPAKRLDLGKGKGKELEAEVRGGRHGIIIDARGRPMEIPDKREAIAAWAKAMIPGMPTPRA